MTLWRHTFEILKRYTDNNGVDNCLKECPAGTWNYAESAFENERKVCIPCPGRVTYNLNNTWNTWIKLNTRHFDTSLRQWFASSPEPLFKRALDHFLWNKAVLRSDTFVPAINCFWGWTSFGGGALFWQINALARKHFGQVPCRSDASVTKYRVPENIVSSYKSLVQIIES